MPDPFALVATGDAMGLTAVLADDPAVAATRDDVGVSLVRQAAYHQRPDLVALVLTFDPPLDDFDAAAVGRADLLGEVDPDAISTDGFPILSLACFFGHVDAARVLLDRGADANAVATNGTLLRPVHAAAAGRHVDILRLLLAHGADANAEQRGGFTAMDAARQHDDMAMADVLLAGGAHP
jgi:ankyrin repeat protein